MLCIYCIVIAEIKMVSWIHKNGKARLLSVARQRLAYYQPQGQVENTINPLIQASEGYGGAWWYSLDRVRGGTIRIDDKQTIRAYT